MKQTKLKCCLLSVSNRFLYKIGRHTLCVQKPGICVYEFKLTAQTNEETQQQKIVTHRKCCTSNMYEKTTNSMGSLNTSLSPHVLLQLCIAYYFIHMWLQLQWLWPEKLSQVSVHIFTYSGMAQAPYNYYCVVVVAAVLFDIIWMDVLFYQLRM